MLDNVGLRYPHRASGAKAPRTLRPLPLLRFAVSATGGAHLCSIQYYLRFWLGICRTSLAVSALRIMRYCHKWQKEQEEQAMNITVYLGAKEGNDPALKRAVQELGQWIGQSGNALVYGGSKTGLMGEIAKSVLDAGGTVTGVETTLFMQDDLQYDGLTELIVTETITERKTEMIRRGDAFIAFPGGTGTLEEIAEVMSKVSLKQLDAPCILYNLNGYYNGLKTLLDHMIETGLSTKERQEGIWFAENLEQIKQILKA
jgi:uncharacterized protein (TIGR00730 family)